MYYIYAKCINMISACAYFPSIITKESCRYKSWQICIIITYMYYSYDIYVLSLHIYITVMPNAIIINMISACA